jgi:citrate synthase
MAVAGAGLEGVIAAESQICYIDGAAGILSYRGYNIHTLAANASFEEVAYLLWQGRLPRPAELEELKSKLWQWRALPPPVADFLRSVPTGKPMDVLRTAVSMLGLYDDAARDKSAEANQARAIRLLAQTSVIVTTFDRLRKGMHVLSGDPKLGFAANFLYCLIGRRPDPVAERAFDVALTLHADHEFNASTFAGRVTAATLSDIYSAVTSAIGALQGPLHGGANEDVMLLLLDTGTAERAVQLVREMLARKKKVPGFGHRVYRTEDPRATHLRELSEELGRRTSHLELFHASRAVETLVREQKNLNPNVDFYSASTYYSLGIPIDLFTPVFAISRMSGWTAHILEQYANNRLIRPRAEYTGPTDGQPWAPPGERS